MYRACPAPAPPPSLSLVSSSLASSSRGQPRRSYRRRRPGCRLSAAPPLPPPSAIRLCTYRLRPSARPLPLNRVAGVLNPRPAAAVLPSAPPQLLFVGGTPPPAPLRRSSVLVPFAPSPFGRPATRPPPTAGARTAAEAWRRWGGSALDAQADTDAPAASVPRGRDGAPAAAIWGHGTPRAPWGGEGDRVPIVDAAGGQ